MPKPTRKRVRDLQASLANAEQRIAECLRTKNTKLDLTNLGLDRLPESLRELTWLQHLEAHKNKLSCLPDWLGELADLRDLNLFDNPLQSLPLSLSQLVRLTFLNIGGTSAKAASEVIGSLVNLKTLVIWGLGLTQVPEWARQLRNLESIYLFKNQLTELPEWLGELPRLTHMDVDNNLMLRIPAEISNSKDARKILNFYFRTATPGTGQPLNEFKLILVGRGGVGKTTLVHRLIEGKYKEFQRTPGINITKWPRMIDGDDVHAHIWDFGGQEIMHGTHRFFMTERALYLVLISGREGTEDHDAEYWLSMVRSFAGDVPVIVLLNKFEDYRFELNRELLREKYSRDLVFVETDSYTGQGIPALCEQICAHAKKLPGLKAAWPAAWRRVKDELPAQKKSWLTFLDFRNFCSKRKITDPKDQESLAESLHDLGMMLSYQKEEALRAFGVLNPEWVTDGIYKVLNSPLLRDAEGKFTVKSFAEVLPESDYPQKLHPYLLALMRKFQLCHPLDDKNEKFLIPELLTKEEPKMEVEFPPEKCLGFIYRYDTGTCLRACCRVSSLKPMSIENRNTPGAPVWSWNEPTAVRWCAATYRG